MLKRYGESGQPYLVPDFSGITLSFSPFNLMLAVSLLYIALEDSDLNWMSSSNPSGGRDRWISCEFAASLVYKS